MQRMQQHDTYGKMILERAAGCNCDGPSTITSYGESSAHIDGVVGSTIAVEIESRTGKQVRGAVLDLILHVCPKKLMILLPMYIGRYQVQECEFILRRFLDPKDFCVVLLDGTGQNPCPDKDVPRVSAALHTLGWGIRGKDLGDATNRFPSKST
jgi:hypothetical protein